MTDLDSLSQRRHLDNTHQKPREDTEAIKDAQNFFRSMGLALDNDGLVSQNLANAQIAKLAEWHEQTKEAGMDMPTESTFYKKVLLAVSLWHQSENEKTNYLLGKGIGVEVALKGRVSGRIKRPIEFSYRCDSDFELYGVNYAAEANGGNTTNQPIYTKPFVEVLGGQEYFPLTKTKGLKNIPPTLLHRTAETVDFGGIPVLIPQLELLFLDKFIARESTPRPEGYDHELLAKQYVLDRAKVHQYLDQLVIKPGLVEIELASIREYQSHFAGIKRQINQLKRDFEGKGGKPSAQDLVTELNKTIQDKIDPSWPERTFSFSGIRVHLWEPLAANQIDDEGNITDIAFLERFQQKLNQAKTTALEKDQKKHQELDDLFGKIEREFDPETAISQQLAVL